MNPDQTDQSDLVHFVFNIVYGSTSADENADNTCCECRIKSEYGTILRNLKDDNSHKSCFNNFTLIFFG